MDVFLRLLTFNFWLQFYIVVRLTFVNKVKIVVAVGRFLPIIHHVEHARLCAVFSS